MARQNKKDLFSKLRFTMKYIKGMEQMYDENTIHFGPSDPAFPEIAAKLDKIKKDDIAKIVMSGCLFPHPHFHYKAPVNAPKPKFV